MCARLRRQAVGLQGLRQFGLQRLQQLQGLHWLARFGFGYGVAQPRRGRGVQAQQCVVVAGDGPPVGAGGGGRYRVFGRVHVPAHWRGRPATAWSTPPRAAPAVRGQQADAGLRVSGWPAPAPGVAPTPLRCTAAQRRWCSGPARPTRAWPAPLARPLATAGGRHRTAAPVRRRPVHRSGGRVAAAHGAAQPAPRRHHRRARCRGGRPRAARLWRRVAPRGTANRPDWRARPGPARPPARAAPPFAPPLRPGPGG